MKEDLDIIEQNSNLLKDYFKLGWELYKDYYKPLIGAQLLAIITFNCVVIISLITYMIILMSFSPIEQLLMASNLSELFALGFMVPGFICFVAFIGSLFGMSNEIISSGDYYTELKSSFTYFRKYWWQYSLIALCSYFGFLIIVEVSTSISQLIPETFMILFPIILYSILFLFESLVFLVPVALSSTGSLKKALSHTFKLLKDNPRVYLTICAIFSIFFISIDVIFEVLKFYYNGSIVLFFLALLLFCVSFFIIFPFKILISTIMYHSIFNKGELNSEETN